MVKTLRDSQRSKVYKAENAVFQPMVMNTELKTPLPEVKDVERYITTKMVRKTLLDRYGYAARFDKWPVKVADGRGTRRALAYGTYKISLPLWARYDWVVCHEMAHILHNRLNLMEDPRSRYGAATRGSRHEELVGDSASHGWQFAAIYLDLVRFCMGREAEAALKASFKDRKVRFRAKRQAPPGAAERMRALQAARKQAQEEGLKIAASTNA